VFRVTSKDVLRGFVIDALGVAGVAADANPWLYSVAPVVRAVFEVLDAAQPAGARSSRATPRSLIWLTRPRQTDRS
jgi:heme/copper-type cytochrome/quinol oxidase subunit 2